MNNRAIDFVGETKARYNRRQRAASFGTPVPIGRPTPVLVHAPEGEDRRPAAFGPGPCPRCETRGTIGCAHQRPYVAPPAPDMPDERPTVIYGPYSPEEDERIRAGLGQGMTQAQLALAMRRTEGSISSHVRFLKRTGFLS